MAISIIQALKDPDLLGQFLGGDLTTWKPWLVCLRAIYGLPIRSKAGREIVQLVTGRDPDLMPEDGFRKSLFLTGRRSGKSRIAAVIGAYEAVLSGRDERLAKGEQGLVAIISPMKDQSKVIAGYLHAIFEDTPLFKAEVKRRTASGGFELYNNVRVEILAGDWRTCRGFTLLTALVDEICFLHTNAEMKVTDTELINAILPGLITTGGRFIGLSSPYAKKGYAYKKYETCFGNDKAKTLVLNAPSRTLNPTLSQKEIDDALAEDYALASAEYLGQWRDDVGLLVPREVVEGMVVDGREQLSPKPGISYRAFADLSGGRSDDAALCIGYFHNGKVIIAKLVRWKAPFNPHKVLSDMSEILRRYGLRSCCGDNYSAEFVARGFEQRGVGYEKSQQTKNELYMNFLSHLQSGGIELLDNDALVDQIASLQRKTRSGGRDIIDHPAGGHDDLANVVAGVAELVNTKTIKVGALFR